MHAMTSFYKVNNKSEIYDVLINSSLDADLTKQIIIGFTMFTDMSFCRGSVNCHGSDGQMYHFCESSRSGEIFLDQYRGGVGVFIPRDKFIRIGLFRSVNRPSVASES